MRKETKHLEKHRFTEKTGNPLQDRFLSDESFGMNGVFFIPTGLCLNGKPLPFKVIASDQGGWDHISVSLPHRCPTWEEMCIIKNLFFEEEECATQYHPPKSTYVNNNGYCLHLWRNQTEKVIMPPLEFV